MPPTPQQTREDPLLCPVGLFSVCAKQERIHLLWADWGMTHLTCRFFFPFYCIYLFLRCSVNPCFFVLCCRGCNHRLVTQGGIMGLFIANWPQISHFKCAHWLLLTNSRSHHQLMFAFAFGLHWVPLKYNYHLFPSLSAARTEIYGLVLWRKSFLRAFSHLNVFGQLWTFDLVSFGFKWQFREQIRDFLMTWIRPVASPEWAASTCTWLWLVGRQAFCQFCY